MLLKKYCPKGNFKTTGSKAEHAARVFGASKMAVPLTPTAEEQIAGTEREKAELLVMPDVKQLPVPLALKDVFSSAERKHNHVATDIPERYNFILDGRSSRKGCRFP